MGITALMEDQVGSDWLIRMDKYVADAFVNFNLATKHPSYPNYKISSTTK